MAAKTQKLVTVKPADAAIDPVKDTAAASGTAPITPVKPSTDHSVKADTKPIDKPPQNIPAQSAPAIAVRASTDPTIEQSAAFKAEIKESARKFLAMRPNAANLGARPVMPDNKAIKAIVDARCNENPDLDYIETLDVVRAEYAVKIRDWDQAQTGDAPILAAWLRYTIADLQATVADLIQANPGAVSAKIAKNSVKVKTVKAEKGEKSESIGSRSSNAELNQKIIAYAKGKGVDAVMVTKSPNGVKGTIFAYRMLADGKYQPVEYNVQTGAVMEIAGAAPRDSWKSFLPADASTSVAQTATMALLVNPGAATHKDRITLECWINLPS